jgi:hypothetical protein
MSEKVIHTEITKEGPTERNDTEKDFTEIERVRVSE